MAARDCPIGADAQPDEYIAAEAFDQRQTLADLARVRDLGLERSFGELRQNLVDQHETLFDLANAHPDARVDVALLENGDIELQRVVGRIAWRAAHVHGA